MRAQHQGGSDPNHLSAPRRSPSGIGGLSRKRQRGKRLAGDRAEVEAQAGELDLIFEALTDGLMVYDPDGRVVRTNAAVRRILGMDAVPPDAYARSVRERASLYVVRDVRGATLAPEDWPAMRILRGEELTGPHTMDIQVRIPDGREVFLNVSGGPLRDRVGRLIGAVCVYRDQTECKRLETSERETQRLLRTTFEQAAVGIAHTSPQGRWLRFNRRLCAIVGYNREELAARTLQEITHPDDLDASVAHFQRMLAGELDIYETDKRYIRKEGVPVWVHLTASLVRTPEGEPDYFISTVQDITERKRFEQERARLLEHERAARAQAEAALARASASEAHTAERAEQLQTILETMADGVLVSDHRGRPLQMNRAYRDLLAADHVPGFETMPTADWVHRLDMRDATEGEPLPFGRIPLVRALKGEIVTGPDADFRMRALDGRELEVSASAAPLRDRDGHIVGAVTVVRDITWPRRLEHEREVARASELAAREASQRMEEFLATAAHDLRTPVGTTVGFIDLADLKFQRLASKAQGECPTLIPQVEAARVSLEEATLSGERLSRLVNVLLDTAAIRAGKLELHHTRFDLAALVREQVEAQRIVVLRRTIRLHVSSDEPVFVNADAERIGQVIANYLTNALKYSPPERPVDVSVEAEGGWARVAVRDEGLGLAVDEQTRIWVPFHQVPGVAVQGGAIGSLGLGLHISKTIIEAHGGQVGVESEVGRGSTFWFALLLSNPASGAAQGQMRGPAGIAH